ncbi:hypothetical protein C483_17728 [Natrialba hulunbeirensis JCM 10989]|uniref:Uncharacterized protein n=1 Tax=Natrialba hulunbeirensis JCM 10989 TaxID=1227493 RepID=L9ZNW7_9EURY|nr:hypothetical protein [Natrialba hulunbeirensis]ELY87761.1 hypothetical protein C483_17728 [Natrialba hulunbeirensis JCM 10989]
MRLTPSWIRSSSADTPEEQSVDGDASLDVPIYHSADGIQSPGEPESETNAIRDDRPADAFLPDSDATLCAILEDLSTPVTVDELVDALISRADPPEPGGPASDTASSTPPPATDDATVPVKTWATIHEELHQDRLPRLDEEGVLEFEPTCGTVDCSESGSMSRLLRSPAVAGMVSIGLLFVLAVLVTASMYTAVTVTVAATTFAVWFLPAYGVI